MKRRPKYMVVGGFKIGLMQTYSAHTNKRDALRELQRLRKLAPDATFCLATLTND